MSPMLLASLMMIASGSIHALVNGIVKGGRDKAAARALTDGSGAIIMLPVLPFVTPPDGARGLAGGECAGARRVPVCADPRL